MSNDNEVFYRAIITGRVRDNSVYGALKVGDSWTATTKAYRTPSAIKAAVTRRRQEWPFNERQYGMHSGNQPVAFESVVIEKAELVWKETTI